jgi:hypothetical protein
VWHAQEGLDINSKHLPENPDSSVTGVGIRKTWRCILNRKNKNVVGSPVNQDMTQAGL